MSARGRTRPRVLVTNDDGIASPGLKALVDELAAACEVVVVAPAREQSGIGTAVSWGRPISVTSSAAFGDVRSYSVDGTPSDCVIVASEVLKIAPDLVVSGVNPGPNMGIWDIFLSGTFGAARHAATYGLPAMAISIGEYRGSQFGAASRVAGALVAVMLSSRQKLILNINVPNKPLADMKRMVLTRPYGQEQGSFIKAKTKRNGTDSLQCELFLGPVGPGKKGSDCWAVSRDLISVSAIGKSPGRQFRRELQALLDKASEKVLIR